MMRRPPILGLEIAIAIAVGIAGGVYTVQPALQAMKQRHELVAATNKEGPLLKSEALTTSSPPPSQHSTAP